MQHTRRERDQIELTPPLSESTPPSLLWGFDAESFPGRNRLRRNHKGSGTFHEEFEDVDEHDHEDQGWDLD